MRIDVTTARRGAFENAEFPCQVCGAWSPGYVIFERQDAEGTGVVKLCPEHITVEHAMGVAETMGWELTV